ncbi:hypothetical protein C8A05DRAFT_29969 [Staphylotrichum tortipilum]|uniref:Uncharacterized protein n=1 Tax=Staphylotrichum tortipilum TaxID=2831512 RepID=A0AAN6RXK9_9PEZI|nr:hypothetical protein C8A05DRAFT_29969 [Staphylotrichum longicolle]
MPAPVADAAAHSSSLLLAKCGTTLFCIARSVVLWLVVLAVLLLGALRNRLFGVNHRASRPLAGDKKI